MKRLFAILAIIGLLVWTGSALAADGDPVLEPITIDQIESTDLSGSDGTLITGTAGTNTYAAVWNGDGDLVDGPGVPAITDLSNIASTAIPVSLISDTAGTDDLGSEAIFWQTGYFKSTLSFEGATDDDYQTVFSITDPTTADRTITVPNSDQTIGVATSAGAGAIDAITEIDAGLKTGSDTKLVTGTAGTNTYAAVWNADGDLVDGPGVPAVVALSNLASVAINTNLVSDTANTDDLGTAAIFWRKLYLASDIQFEGSTDDAHNTTVTVTDPTGARTITIPDSDQTVGTATSAAADAIDAITEIASALKSGSDTTLITGTAGSNGNLAVWNADGDVVDGGSPTGTPGSFGSASAVTIASGVIDLSAGANYASVDGEGAAADDLTEIQAAAAGDIVVLQRKQGVAYTITVKDGSYMQLQADFALDHDDDTITLICETASTNDIFKEIARSNAG